MVNFPQKKFIFLSWAILFLFCLSVGFFYWVIYRPTMDSIRQKTVELQMKEADTIETQVNFFLEENSQALVNLAKTINHFSDPTVKRIFIEDFMRERGWLNQISLVDKSGLEIAKFSQFKAFGPQDMERYSGRSFFSQAIEGEISISPVDFDDKSTPYFFIAVPVKSAPDTVSAVVMTQVSFRKIWEILSQFPKSETTDIFLVDEAGFLVASDRQADVLEKVNLFNRKGIGETAKQVIVDKKEVLRTKEDEGYYNEQDEERYVIGTPIDMTGWGLLYDKSMQEVWLTYRQISIVAKVIGVGTALLILLLVYNNWRLVRAFKQLENQEDQLAKEIDKRNRELSELDKTSKLLVRRDVALNTANTELDKKIAQIEESRKSLLTAYREITTERNKNLAIISNITSPIIVLDSNNTVVMFNYAAQNILGVQNKDLGTVINKSYHFRLENFSKIIRKRFKVLKISKSKDSYQEEIELISKGETLFMKVLTVNITSKDTKEYLGVMKIFYDLTREKMIDKMKSDFISIAAHQLRTPLSAIKWVIQMVIDGDTGPINEEQRDLLMKGFRSNQRMIELVNDLLNVSRIEEGRFGYQFQNGNVLDSLNIVFENYEKIFAKNHLQVTLEKPDKLPLINMDKSRLALAFQNVIDNAVKYTPEYGRIRIKLEERDNEVIISVKDSGIGIPDDDKGKLFTKFFRAANVLRVETEGSGLGMFIIKNIIDRHGGKVKVTSQEGKGTEVTIILPVKPPKKLMVEK